MAFVHVNVFANTFDFACERVCLRVRMRLAWRVEGIRNAHALYVASGRYCKSIVLQMYNRAQYRNASQSLRVT